MLSACLALPTLPSPPYPLGFASWLGKAMQESTREQVSGATMADASVCCDTGAWLMPSACPCHATLIHYPSPPPPPPPHLHTLPAFLSPSLSVCMCVQRATRPARHAARRFGFSPSLSRFVPALFCIAPFLLTPSASPLSPLSPIPLFTLACCFTQSHAVFTQSLCHSMRQRGE